jgi:adenine-specific DNA-methyltransferase
VRHHHIAADQKERLREACRHICGGRIDGLSGLYCYFIVLCHEWLAEDGLGVWLVPSEFMDVNYGLWIKRYLSERVTLLRIHRFDPNEVQFGDALVSSAVVFFRKKSPLAFIK